MRLLVLFLMLASSAKSSPVFVGGTAAAGTGATTIAVSYTVGSSANEILILSGFGGGLQNITAASFGGSSFTKLTSAPLAGGSNYGTFFFYLINPPAALGNLTVTADGVITNGVVILTEYSGVAQSGQFPVFAIGTTQSLTITATKANSLVISTLNNGTSNQTPTGYTNRISKSASGTSFSDFSELAISSAGSVNAFYSTFPNFSIQILAELIAVPSTTTLDTGQLSPYINPKQARRPFVSPAWWHP